MFDWLGERHGVAACAEAVSRLTGAVERAYAAGDLRPFEMGGTAGTEDVTGRVREALWEGRG